MSVFDIRGARPDDVPAILALHNDAIVRSTAIWMDAPVDLANRRAWFAERRRRGFPVFVAEGPEGFLGYASYGDFRAGDGYRRVVENSVYVSEAARGRGVARALMEALFDAAREKGIAVMVAAVGLPNDASLRLHRALGFEDVGVLRGVGIKFGRSLDLMMLQKTL